MPRGVGPYSKRIAATRRMAHLRPQSSRAHAWRPTLRRRGLLGPWSSVDEQALHVCRPVRSTFEGAGQRAWVDAFRARTSGCRLGVPRACRIQQDAGLVSHSPCVVSRLQPQHVAGPDSDLGAVVRANRHPPGHAEAGVPCHAGLGPGNRLDVVGPPPAWLEGPLDQGEVSQRDHIGVAVLLELPGLVRTVDAACLKLPHVFSFGSASSGCLLPLNWYGPSDLVEVSTTISTRKSAPRHTKICAPPPHTPPDPPTNIIDNSYDWCLSSLL